jgi:hypothetical protein
VPHLNFNRTRGLQVLKVVEVMRVVGQQELLLYSLKRSKSRPARTDNEVSLVRLKDM